MIKTGYFKKYFEGAYKGYTAISIAVYPPAGYSGASAPLLMPDKDTLSKDVSFEEYKRRYYEKLMLHKDEIRKYISSLPSKTVLLCYEADNSHCHRRLLSAFCKKAFNMDITELDKAVPVNKHEMYKENPDEVNKEKAFIAYYTKQM